MLVARILVGAIFIYAGWVKVSDMSMTLGFFSQMGLGSFVAYLVSYAELLGGIALVLGLWAELASLGLIIIMLGAVYFGYKGALASGTPLMQALMPNIAIIAALLAVMGAGAGKLALRFGKKSE